MAAAWDAARRRRVGVAAGSVAAHLAILALLLTAQGTPPKLPDAPPMVVQLVKAEPPPADPVAEPTPAPPAPAKPPPPRNVARPARTPPPDVRPLPSGKPTPSSDGDAEVSDSQLASAASAGSGPAGRCDMAGQLQAALRRNSLVQAAVAEARSESARGQNGAMFVWNGDWVRSHGQDGAGLAAVREAIMWEIAFAPEACRAQPVHGLVLLSLNDAPGGGRLVMGEGDWRWSDMLKRH